MFKDTTYSQEAEKIGRERINHWLETGFSKDAVAVYGTDTQVIKQIAYTGNIPSITPSELPGVYPEGFRSLGNHVYFFYPLMENILEMDTELAGLLEEDIQTKGDTFFQDIYTQDSLRKLSREYAHRAGFTAKFAELTGVEKASWWRYLAVAGYKLFPRQSEIWLEESGFSHTTDLDELLDAPENHERAEIIIPQLKTIPVNDVYHAFEQAYKRKGANIYFNTGVITPTSRTGYEADYELLTITQLPLQAGCIAGVEVFSEFDMCDLLK